VGYPEFFQTKMGAMFYDGTMPRIAKALTRIADQLEADAKERQAPEMPLAPPCDAPSVPDPSWEVLVEAAGLMQDIMHLEDLPEPVMDRVVKLYEDVIAITQPEEPDED
jgi:hypothetical protein